MAALNASRPADASPGGLSAAATQPGRPPLAAVDPDAARAARARAMDANGAAAASAAPRTLPPGHIRSLWSSEREKLTAHFLRLSDDDLHRRFHGPISAHQLEDHVDEAFAPHRHVIGFFQDHELRGAVELDENGRAVEAAVTVEKALRGRGVGHALLKRALERAAARGHGAVVVHTTRMNGPMVRLARSLDAQMEADGPDVSGLIPVKRAEPMRLLFDLAMDEAKLAGMLLSANRRFWTGKKG